MACFNFGIDCPSEEIASALQQSIESTNIFKDGLDCCDERVSVISNSSMKDVLKDFAAQHQVELSVEVWPEDLEYDEAEESDQVESYSFG